MFFIVIASDHLEKGPLSKMKNSSQGIEWSQLPARPVTKSDNASHSKTPLYQTFL